MNTSFASGAPVSWDLSYSVASHTDAGGSPDGSVAGAGTGTTREGGSLATTGVNLDIMVSLGLVMIGLGALIVTRRRRTRS